MSAWLCSQDHLNVMVCFAIDMGVSTHPANDPESLTRMLADENMRSLRARYDDEICNEPDGWAESAAAYKFERVADVPGRIRKNHNRRNKLCAGRFGKLPPLTMAALATQIVKACDCYDYQASETDDYPETPVAAFVERLRAKAIELGGQAEGRTYDALMWGID